VFLLIYFVALV